VKRNQVNSDHDVVLRSTSFVSKSSAAIVDEKLLIMIGFIIASALSADSDSRLQQTWRLNPERTTGSHAKREILNFHVADEKRALCCQ
jgi:hypothetical protein